MIPQVDDFGHVHLVDVREMGCRDVRLRHLVEDPLAQAVDRDPFLRAAWGYRDRGGGRRSSSHGGASRGPTDVVLRETSFPAAPPDRRPGHPPFPFQASDRGCGEDVAPGDTERK